MKKKLPEDNVINKSEDIVDNKKENEYADIINLPYRKSRTRKRMSNHDRAAQFAPFAALNGYYDSIKTATDNNASSDTPVIISEEDNMLY